MRIKSISPPSSNPKMRYLVYITHSGNPMGRRDGNPQTIWPHLSHFLPLFVQALTSSIQHIACVLHTAKRNEKCQWLHPRQISYKYELNLLTATTNNFQRGPQCNRQWRYSLMKSFSTFNHKPCCHIIKKSSIWLTGQRNMAWGCHVGKGLEVV